MLCIWKSFIDLNKDNDNFSSIIDCIDPKTGLYYQVKGRLYYDFEQVWNSDIRHEYNALKKGIKFVSLFYFCVSKDRKIVERIYEFPANELIDRTSISIYKNPTPSRGPFWYEQYRIMDEETIKKVNDIWKDIIKKIKKRT